MYHTNFHANSTMVARKGPRRTKIRLKFCVRSWVFYSKMDAFCILHAFESSFYSSLLDWFNIVPFEVMLNGKTRFCLQSPRSTKLTELFSTIMLVAFSKKMQTLGKKRGDKGVEYVITSALPLF